MTNLIVPAQPALFLKKLLQRDFVAFLIKAWPWISGGEALAWNWHLDAIAYALGCIARGQNRRLLVTVPPRNGKSKTISVIWVAFMLGLDPTLNFVCVSYSNELSAKMARDCLAIMRSHWYRELFPRTIISSLRFTAIDFETTAGGGRLATSVTGTLTGRGGDIIILDDVIKPEEANSDTTREFVNGWYRSTLASRLNDKASGAIICVMQRLHQFDLAGMLIEAGGWQELKLPAIATEDQTIALTRGRTFHRKIGDILHPAREPLAVLDALKAAMGSYAFASQYQQDPVPAVGNIFKAAWLTSTFDLDSFVLTPGRIVQSWDTASKDNPHSDWSVCITALVRGNEVYILNVMRAKLEIYALRDRAINLAREWHPQILLIEDQASGTQLIQILREMKPLGVPMPIARHPEMDKMSRAMGASSMVEAGQLHLPAYAPWLAEFKSEILAFPSARYDDQVDALSQLLGWVQQQNSVPKFTPVAPIVVTGPRPGPGWD
jgi:predicted phage terminase large subunit-like protein